MTQKMVEHVLSIGLIIGLLSISLLLLKPEVKDESMPQEPLAAVLSRMDFIDVNNDFHRVLAEDAANLYFPGQKQRNTNIVSAWFQARQDAFLEQLQTAHLRENLDRKKAIQLLVMTGKFILTYVLVMLLTYYAVQTIGVWRFVKKKQADYGHVTEVRGFTDRTLKVMYRIGRFALSLIMFCPAYVIAYSFRTEFSSDSFLFVIILGVISNGLLITYANKFYQFLLSESRKGFVETALVKNLDNSWAVNEFGGIPLKSILHPIKRFKGHVFGTIFTNAAHQYLATIKEQGAFLVTGLVIIEMALNIHGHLSYEMLRQLLHKNFDIVIASGACIFLTVKMTEITGELLVYRAGKRFENT